MKKNTKLVGICIMAAGLMILLTCFLPPSALVCIQAVLLVLVGLCYFCS